MLSPMPTMTLKKRISFSQKSTKSRKTNSKKKIQISRSWLNVWKKNSRGSNQFLKKNSKRARENREKVARKMIKKEFRKDSKV